jgi:hypothetical protein
MCRFLQKLPSRGQRLDLTHGELRDTERKALEKLEELCAQEILRAILGNWIEAGLCGVYVGVEKKPPYTILWIVREDVEIIYAGIRKAISSVAVSGVPFHKHVEDCVAKALSQEAAELAQELKEYKPRALLKECTSWTLDRTRFIVEYLCEEQRAALANLLFHELGGKPRPMRMDVEPTMPERPTPKQRQAWLYAYLYRLKMHEPEISTRLGGVPRFVVACDGDRILINKSTGKPADPLGPIHAKVYEKLGRELNKHGHPIKDPESKNRIARGLGVSRATLQRYLDANVPVKLTPDGRGGVHHEFNMNSMLMALEVSARRSRRKK